MKNYSFKTTYKNFNYDKVNVQQVGERLEKLKNLNDGVLKPKIVVDDAKNKNSPLHNAFEWNNNRAAEQWLLQQARNLINSIEIKVITSHKEVKTKLFFNIKKNEYQGTREYKTTEDIMNNPVDQEKVRQTFISELERLQKKFEIFEFLSNEMLIFDEIISSQKVTQKI